MRQLFQSVDLEEEDSNEEQATTNSIQLIDLEEDSEDYCYGILPLSQQSKPKRK